MAITLRTDRNLLVSAVTRSGKTTWICAAGTLAADAIGKDRVKAVNPRREPLVTAWAADLGIECIVPDLDARGRLPGNLSRKLREWYSRGNVLVVCDEIQMVAKIQDPDPAWRYWFSAGNGRGCAVWGTTTVAAMLPGDAVTQSVQMVSFRQTDLTTLRKFQQRSPELAAWVSKLQPYEWVYHELGSPPVKMAPIPWEGIEL